MNGTIFTFKPGTCTLYWLYYKSKLIECMLNPNFPLRKIAGYGNKNNMP